MEMIPMATDQSPVTNLGIRPFRLRPIMRQGTASSVPETWTKYASVAEARTGAKHMYHNDRVAPRHACRRWNQLVRRVD